MLVISDVMALLFCTREATLLIGKQYPKMQRRMTSAAQYALGAKLKKGLTGVRSIVREHFS